MEDDTLVTLSDVAEEFNVSRRAVLKWAGYPDWPASAGTVIRAGRPRTGYRWGDVFHFCEVHQLPNRERQEEMRRAREARGK